MALRPLTTPCSEACERNKGPILAELRAHFARATRVLEIGSGTGQHTANYLNFAKKLLRDPSLAKSISRL